MENSLEHWYGLHQNFSTWQKKHLWKIRCDFLFDYDPNEKIAIHGEVDKLSSPANSRDIVSKLY